MTLLDELKASLEGGQQLETDSIARFLFNKAFESKNIVESKPELFKRFTDDFRASFDPNTMNDEQQLTILQDFLTKATDLRKKEEDQLLEELSGALIKQLEAKIQFVNDLENDLQSNLNDYERLKAGLRKGNTQDSEQHKTIEKELNEKLNQIAQEKFKLEQLNKQRIATLEQITEISAETKITGDRIAQLEQETDEEETKQDSIIQAIKVNQPTESESTQELIKKIASIKSKKLPETDINDIKKKKPVIKAAVDVPKITPISIPAPPKKNSILSEIPDTQQKEVVNSTELLSQIDGYDSLNESLQTRLHEIAQDFTNKINDYNDRIEKTVKESADLDIKHTRLQNDVDYQNKMEEYISVIKKYSNKLRETEDELQTVTEEVSRLSEQKQQLDTKLEALESTQKNHLEQVKELEHQKAVLLQTTPLFQQLKIIALEEQVEKLNKDLDKINKAMQSASEQTKASQQMNIEMQQALALAIHQKDATLAEKQALTNRYELEDKERENSSNDSKLSIEAEILRQKEMEDLKQKLENAESTFTRITHALEQERRENAQKESTLQELTSKYNALEEEYKRLQVTYDKDLKENKALASSLDAKTAEAKAAILSIARLGKELDEASTLNGQLVDKIRNLEEENTTLNNRVLQLDTELQETKSALSQEKNNVAAAIDEATRLKDLLEQEQGKVTDLTIKMEKFKKEKTSETDQLTQQLREAEERIASIQLELDGQNNKLAASEENVSGLSTKINSLESLNAKLQHELDESKDENTDLQRLLSNQKEQTTEALDTLRTVRSELTAAIGENGVLKAQASSLNETNNKLIIENEALRETISELESQVLKLSGNIESTKSELEAATSELISSKKSNESIKASLDATQATLDTLQQKADEKRKQYETDLSQGAADATALKDQHDQEMKELRAEYDKANSKITTFTQQLSDESKKFTDQQAIVDRLNDELSTLKLAHTDLQASFVESESKNSKLEKDLASQLATIVDTTLKLATTTKQLETLTEEHNTLKLRTTNLEQQNQLLQTKNSELEDQTRHLSLQLNTNAEKLATTAKQLTDANAAAEGTKSKLEDAANIILGLNQKVTELKKQHALENSANKGSIDDYEQKMSDFDKERKAAEATFAQITADLTAKSKLLDDLQAQHDELTNEFTALKSAHDSLDATYKSSLLTNKDLNSLLDTQTQLTEKTTTELTEVRNSLSKLTAQHQQLIRTADSLKSENEALRFKTDKLSIQVIELQSKLLETSKALEKEKGVVKAAEQITTETRTLLETERLAVQTLKREFDSQELQYKEELATINKDNLEAIDKLNMKHSAAKELLTAELQKASEKIASIESKLATQTDELEASKATIFELKSKIEASENKYTALDDQFKLSGSDNAALKQLLEQQQTNFEQLKSSLADTMVTLNAAQQENNYLKTQLADLAKINGELLNQISTLKATIDSLNKSLAATTTELASATSKAEEFEAANKEIQLSLSKAENTSASLKKQMEEQQKQHELAINAKDADQYSLIQQHESKMTALQAELSAATDEINRIKSVIKEQKSQLETSQREIDQLKATLASIQAENQKLIQTKSEYSKEKNELVLQLRTQKAEIEKAVAETGSTKVLLNKSLETNSELELKTINLATENTQLLGEISSLKDQNSTLVREMKTLTTELSAVKLSLDREVEKVTAAEKGTRDARIQLNSANKTIDDLNARITALQLAHKKELEQYGSANEGINNAYDRKISHLQSQLQSVESQCMRITADLEQNKAKLSASETTISDLESRLSTLGTQNQKLNSDIQRLENENLALKSEVFQQTETLASTKRTLSQTSAQLKAAEATNSQLRAEAEETNSKNANLLDQISSLESQVGKLTAQITTQAEELAKAAKQVDLSAKETESAKAKLATANEEIVTLNKQIESLNSRHQIDLETHKHSSDAAITALKIEHSLVIEPLTAKLASARDRISQLNEELLANSQELIQQRTLIAQLNQDKSRLKQELDAAIDSDNSQKLKVSQLTDSIGRINSDLERLKDEISNRSLKIEAQNDELMQARTSIQSLSEQLAALETKHKKDMEELIFVNNAEKSKLREGFEAEKSILIERIKVAEATIARQSTQLVAQEQKIDTLTRDIGQLNYRLSQEIYKADQLSIRLLGADQINQELGSKLETQRTRAYELSVQASSLEAQIRSLMSDNSHLRSALCDRDQRRNTLRQQCISDLQNRVTRFELMRSEGKHDNLDEDKYLKKIQDQDNKLNLIITRWNMLCPAENEQAQEVRRLMDHWIDIQNYVKEIHRGKIGGTEHEDDEAMVTSTKNSPHRPARQVIHDHAEFNGMPTLPNIYMESEGGMQDAFTDMLIENEADFERDLPTNVKKGVEIAFDEPAPTTYKGHHLKEGQSIRSTVVFKSEQEGGAHKTVTGILKQDHTGKVTDMTQDKLTAEQKELMAFKQAKMLLTNCDVSKMTKPVIVIRGDDAEQASRVFAALLLLKKDNPELKDIGIKTKILGCEKPEKGDEDGENFIKKQLPKFSKQGSRSEIEKTQLQELTDKKTKFIQMKSRLRDSTSSITEVTELPRDPSEIQVGTTRH